MKKSIGELADDAVDILLDSAKEVLCLSKELEVTKEELRLAREVLGRHWSGGNMSCAECGAQIDDRHDVHRPDCVWLKAMGLKWPYPPTPFPDGYPDHHDYSPDRVDDSTSPWDRSV